MAAFRCYSQISSRVSIYQSLARRTETQKCEFTPLKYLVEHRSLNARVSCLPNFYDSSTSSITSFNEVWSLFIGSYLCLLPSVFIEEM